MKARKQEVGISYFGVSNQWNVQSDFILLYKFFILYSPEDTELDSFMLLCTVRSFSVVCLSSRVVSSAFLQGVCIFLIHGSLLS